MTSIEKKTDVERTLSRFEKRVPFQHKRHPLPKYGIISRENRDRWTLIPYYGSVIVEHVPGNVLRAREQSGEGSYMDETGELYLPDELRRE